MLVNLSLILRSVLMLAFVVIAFASFNRIGRLGAGAAAVFFAFADAVTVRGAALVSVRDVSRVRLNAHITHPPRSKIIQITKPLIMNAIGKFNQESTENLDGLAKFKSEIKSETFDHAPDSILVFDERLNIILANLKAQSLVRKLNLTLDDVSISKLIPDWNSMTGTSLPRNLDLTKELETEITFSNGETCSVTLGALELNSKRGYILTIRDGTLRGSARIFDEQTYQDLKRDKELLESLVKMDTLTNVLNRRGLESVLSREIEYAKRNRTELLAVMIDLDDFKRINDGYGHAVGDLILKHVASVLKEAVRTIDWLGRVGGDEFLILLPGTTLMSGVKVAERIRLDLNTKVFPLGEEEILQTASLGIVRLPHTVCSIEEILELTKSTLKDSKRRGKNCVSFGSSRNYATIRTAEINTRELLLENSKRRTLIQPVVELHTMNRVGAEVLTRGPTPDYELPELYFKACRDHNLLTLVDLQCFANGIKRTLEEPPGGVIYLNIFPSTLVEVPVEKLVEQIALVKGEKVFCIEVSERHIRSLPDYLIEPLAVLRRNGILIGLDDVGFGHSSLEAVFALTPDVIKIDGRLTSKISENHRNQLVVSKLKKFADSLNSKVIAEAVETEADAQTLMQLGVEFGQGRYFGAPK